MYKYHVLRVRDDVKEALDEISERSYFNLGWSKVAKALLCEQIKSYRDYYAEFDTEPVYGFTA